MSRIRVISATESLFVSNSPSTGALTGIFQLYRVQSCTQGWNLARTDVNQFGQLAPVDRVINTAPTVTLDFSYFMTNVYNEAQLGFVVDGSQSCITHLLDETQDDKNYFLTQAPEGQDDIGYGGDRSVMAVGNGFINSYSSEAAVNGFPTTTVRVEGLNIASYLSVSGQLSPAINPADGSAINQYFTIPESASGIAGQVSVLKHGDILLNLANPQVGVDINDAKVQRYTVAFNLAREPQEKIGSQFAFAREIRFPIAVSLTVEANVGDMTSGNLANILCNDSFYNLGITLNAPACAPATGATKVYFDLRNAKLDSQNFNSTIGPNKTVTMVWTANIGGPEDQIDGLFISGSLI